MTRRSRFFLALIVFCTRVAAQAQETQITVTTSPAAPTAGQEVTIIVVTECACPRHENEIVRNGFVFDIPRHHGCVSGCLTDETLRFDVGPLPAGIYTVRHFPAGETTGHSIIGTFAVHEPPIPTLGFTSLVALGVVLALISIVVLRR